MPLEKSEDNDFLDVNKYVDIETEDVSPMLTLINVTIQDIYKIILNAPVYKSRKLKRIPISGRICIKTGMKVGSNKLYWTKIGNKTSEGDISLGIQKSNKWWISEKGVKSLLCVHCGRVLITPTPIPYAIESNSFNNIICVYAYIYACNFSCAEAYAAKQATSVNRSDHRHETMLNMVRMLFSFIYPEESLTRAGNPLMMARYGGFMADKKFDQDSKFFKLIPSVIIYHTQTVWCMTSQSK